MSDETTKRVAKKLKEARLNRGLTQIEVAEKAKINSNYYSKIERGQAKPSIEVYERLAKTLKVSSSDIFPF